MSELRPESARLFERARAVIPGGVNSPVRAFKSVGGAPVFVRSASGSRLRDVDGREYVDFVGSWGPMILGHADARVAAAIAAALEGGTSFGAPTRREVELASLVLEFNPWAERVRFVNSGTEATMSALRLARGFTGRKLVVKFRGNYHGHADGLLVEAGSGLLTLDGGTARSAPSSAGVPEEYAALTLVAEYNDVASLEAVFARHGADIAAVIFEPVVGNSGVLVPEASFLSALRRVTREHGALLVVDEVMTGFRVAPGGAIERFGIDADLACWGKVIGGGLPVGAYGGRAEVMEFVAPSGPVYQAGTLSGNPLAMAAGIATLSALRDEPGVYARLEAVSARLEAGLRDAALAAGVPVAVNRVGSMLTVFFREAPVVTYADAVASDTRRFARWFNALLDAGVYWPPSQFEAAFVSAAHSDDDVAFAVSAARSAFEVAAR